MRDLYTPKNYKKLLKQIEDKNKWKYLPHSCIRRVCIVILSKVIYRLDTIPIKTLIAVLQKQKKNPKMYVESQKKNLNSLSNLKKEESWRHRTSWFQTILQNLWQWNKNRFVDQWDRVISPEINPCMCSKLTFDKGAKSTQWEKSLFKKWH